MKNVMALPCADTSQQVHDHISRLIKSANARKAAEATTTKQPSSGYVPIVDQVRALLATLAPSEKTRISLSVLLPHLSGKYRERPHYIHVARAMRMLGYVQIRSYKAADGSTGKRFWINQNGEHDVA